MWLEWRTPPRKTHSRHHAGTLVNIMAELGHATVHFLYIDLVCAKWCVFQNWIEARNTASRAPRGGPGAPAVGRIRCGGRRRASAALLVQRAAGAASHQAAAGAQQRRRGTPRAKT